MVVSALRRRARSSPRAPAGSGPQHGVRRHKVIKTFRNVKKITIKNRDKAGSVIFCIFSQTIGQFFGRKDVTGRRGRTERAQRSGEGVPERVKGGHRGVRRGLRSNTGGTQADTGRRRAGRAAGGREDKQREGGGRSGGGRGNGTERSEEGREDGHRAGGGQSRLGRVRKVRGSRSRKS